MTNDTYTVDGLVDVLRRAGFVPCDIPACNCGSWHHRYGLPQRMDEIVEALQEADVLNNSTGNLPIRAISKLVAERDAALAEVERLKSSESVYADQLAATQRLATELRTTNAELGSEVEAAFTAGYLSDSDDVVEVAFLNYQRERGTR